MKDVVVPGLGPAQAYTATITTVWDELRAPSTFVTCYTDSTGEQRARDDLSELAERKSMGLFCLSVCLSGAMTFSILAMLHSHHHSQF
jgi:hypothetical protein